MLFLIILIGVLFIVFATAKLKLHPVGAGAMTVSHVNDSFFW